MLGRGVVGDALPDVIELVEYLPKQLVVAVNPKLFHAVRVATLQHQKDTSSVAGPVQAHRQLRVPDRLDVVLQLETPAVLGLQLDRVDVGVGVVDQEVNPAPDMML